MSTSSGSPHPQQQPNANPKHIGILVIHGMGEANPYGPLDAFARGLYKYYGDSTASRYTMQADWKERGSDPSHKQQSWTQAQVLFVPAPPDEKPVPHLRLAEYYWSPVTKDKMKDIAVLTWLIRTALEPFRYLSENMQAIIAAQPYRSMTRAATMLQRRNLALREMFRLGMVYPWFIASFLALAGFFEGLPQLAVILKDIAVSPKNIVIGLFLATRLLILVSLFGYFLNFSRWRRWRSPKAVDAMRVSLKESTPDPARRYNMELFVWAAIFAALLVLGPVVLTGAWHRPPQLPTSLQPFKDYGWITRHLHCFIPAADHLWRFFAILPTRTRQIWDLLLAWSSRLVMLVVPFNAPTLTIPLAELAIAGIIRNFLINYMGDVAIYTNLNQRSANFALRAQILEECGHALTLLYQDLRKEAGENFEIVIAAHSLGTVIAYDTLNDLFNRARIPAAAAAGAVVPRPGVGAKPLALDICKHMRGLLTFGCPLNKTYYFFRDQSAAEELVRAQIIDQLHSFRLREPAGNSAVPLKPVSPGRTETLIRDFRWVNFWSVMDPFCGHLFFYNLQDQRHRWYPIPILAHTKYWKDQQMYEYFAQQLLC